MTDSADPLTLDTLAVGEKARIVDVTGTDGVATRIMEMGLIEGEAVACLGFAPLGDPIEFEVRGYRVSLRKTEAKRVLISAG